MLAELSKRLGTEIKSKTFGKGSNSYSISWGNTSLGNIGKMGDVIIY